MTSRYQPPGSRGSLRDEAADWFAVMRGPDADARRAEFETWLERNALHREAYNRIAETFSLGKLLRQAPAPEHHASPSSPGSPFTTGRITIAAAFVALAIATALGVISLRSDMSQFPRAVRSALGPGTTPTLDQRPGRFATRVGEIKAFRLADGSTATLDTNSAIAVSMTSSGRVLTLLSGRARFAVVHDGRPFLVKAGSGTVTAVGTLFDVGIIAGGRIDVRLLSGAIDVATRPSAAGADVRRLGPGDAISFGGASGIAMTHAQRLPDANWPQGLRVFDGARLAEVLADANRYAGLPLRTADSDIADLRISGTFRIDDPTRLAENVSEVLGLAQVAGPDGIELLWVCTPTKQKNCRPPS